ncbi:DNA N-6-adenine-methyltransferase [Enterobacter cloacae]|uniref:DNA N-6-adenine-methyltransferase n=1 Tax=Enterobacter cloacae TaxID=550 RepID=UPI002002E352|nr:DNA N-6-adenine-methyltransferase [Enterobacter cloacae]MCK7380275.1 hypothetical protein [Enterobacter cloacae]
MGMNADNKYCRALAELRSKPVHELKEVKDQWRTPDLLFWGINAMFGPLMLDLFADDSNAKCPAWYTAEDNALTQDWSERLANFAAAKFAPPATSEEATPAPVDLPEEESRIWPLEVGLVFSQVEGADSLALGQQNKLKANINQLWLERMPTSEIITVAGGLVSRMQGTVNA